MRDESRTARNSVDFGDSVMERCMNITYACSRCDRTVRREFDAQTASIGCLHCGDQIAVPSGAVAGGSVQRCLVCPSTELFVRKDFNQRLGVTIILVGFLLSTVAWYFYWIYATFAILMASALLDVVLYFAVGDLLQCYRCHAEYRGLENLDEHPRFSLETHEKYRQQAARLNQD
jgi:DNA-directed RNA polymerase subunit RPC12/RpoP